MKSPTAACIVYLTFDGDENESRAGPLGSGGLALDDVKARYPICTSGGRQRRRTHSRTWDVVETAGVCVCVSVCVCVCVCSNALQMVTAYRYLFHLNV